MKKILTTLFFSFITTLSVHADVRDLNDLCQDFVIDTQQIIVPGFPEAFNPSVARWKGKLIMSFRTYDPVTRSSDLMGLAWLDEEFKVVGTPSLIKRVGEITTPISSAKDPRLIVVKDELYIIYSNQYPFEKRPESRMYVGKVQETKGRFTVFFPHPLLSYEKEIRTRKEKNWSPFVFEDQLLLSYSLQPHRVFVPSPKTESCDSFCETIGALQWHWGVLRGGTPALKVDEGYLAFFHSDKAIATKQSGGVVMNHYFMGAYLFQGDFPFALMGISRNPIMAPTFYEGEMHKTWKPLRVVFPSGFDIKDNVIALFYGRQDHEAWVVRLHKDKLIKSLKPVETVTPPVKL